MTSNLNIERTGLLPRLRAFLVLSAILVLLSLVATNFDLAVAAMHQKDVLPGDLRRIIRLSELFAHGFGLAAITATVWLLAPALRTSLPRFVLCGLGASGIAHLMKMVFVRLRPRTYLNPAQQLELPDSIQATWTHAYQNIRPVSEDGAYFVQAFPSAHAAMAVGIAVGLSWLLPRCRWLFAGLAVLACYQRIQSNAHWASDVFAGAAIGALVAGLLIQNWGLGYLLGKFENEFDPATGRMVRNDATA